MLPGTTPADPTDRGAADPKLTAALAAGDTPRIRVALLYARVLVPVVAVPTDGGEAEMAVPDLVEADGRRALPVFSSVAAMSAWRPEARPVPMAGARAVAGVAAEGYDGLVLDVAGPVPHTVAGADLATLAQAADMLRAHPGATIAIV